MIELIPVPSELRTQRATEQGRVVYPPCAKYDYVTSDARWRVEKHRVCGGPAWVVTDTTGQYVCGSCTFTEGHATIVRTLAAAKAFIAEWSA